MASPQLENGHLKIANEVWEHLAIAPMLGSEFQVVLAIIRHTWGWKKKQREISLSEISIMTGLPHSTLARTTRSLVNKCVIIQTKGGGRSRRSEWSFNKDWEAWKLSHLRDCKINSPKINSPTDEPYTVSPTGQLILTDGTVYCQKSLIPLAPESPKAIFKEKKEKKHRKQRDADPRLAPLKEFIMAEYLRLRGCKLVTDGTDWMNVSSMLKSTNGSFDLEQIKKAWTEFLTSKDEFHRKQGKPLRWWCCNINPFLAVTAKPLAPPKPKITTRLVKDADGRDVMIITEEK